MRSYTVGSQQGYKIKYGKYIIIVPNTLLELVIIVITQALIQKHEHIGFHRKTQTHKFGSLHDYWETRQFTVMRRQLRPKSGKIMPLI